MDIDKNFWDMKYQRGETAWDEGSITKPIKEYIDQLTDKDLNILIPGCGYGHEIEYLYQQGFENSFVADISPLPLEALHLRCPQIPENHLLNIDFFDIQMSFDLIIEQTLFCAIDPSLRTRYAEKMASLLHVGGKLAGVLFDDQLNSDHPPFGGTKEEYISYFRPWFDFKYFDRCYNSIPRRAERELFICLVKK